MLAWTITKTKGQNNRAIAKTLLNVHSTFCEGYGQGIVATVISSPNQELVGKLLRVDMRSNVLNQYARGIK